MFAPASVKGSTSEVAGALDDGAEIDAIADKQGGRTALMVRVRQIVLFPTDYVDLQRRLIDLLVVALMTRPMPPTPFTSLAPSYTQVGFLRQQAACLAGKHKVVKKLLTAGADWRIGEKDGYTCMHGAGFQGYSFFLCFFQSTSSASSGIIPSNRSVSVSSILIERLIHVSVSSNICLPE